MKKVKIKGKNRQVIFTDDDIKKLIDFYISYKIIYNSIHFIRLVDESGVKRI